MVGRRGNKNQKSLVRVHSVRPRELPIPSEVPNGEKSLCPDYVLGEMGEKPVLSP